MDQEKRQSATAYALEVNKSLVEVAGSQHSGEILVDRERDASRASCRPAEGR